VETGSAITWKYPSVILKGDDSVGQFHGVALTNNFQQADTGTKMTHIGKNTRSTIVNKGFPRGGGRTPTRARQGAGRCGRQRNFTQCDSLLLGDRCGAHTFPYIEVKNRTAKVEHEASTSRIGEDQLFYCQQRGLSREDAVSMIVSGFWQRGDPEPPHGVRGGGPEAAGNQPRRERRMNAMLHVRTCTPRSATGRSSGGSTSP